MGCGASAVGNKYAADDSKNTNAAPGQSVASNGVKPNAKPSNKSSKSTAARNHEVVQQLVSKEKLVTKYKLGKVLGEGAFGIVYLATDVSTREALAVKLIDKSSSKLEEVEQEIHMLKKCESEWVVNVYAVFFEKAYICIVMDYYIGGDMLSALETHWESKGAVPIVAMQRVSRQMFDCTSYLHSVGVIHRDIKGDNFLSTSKVIENPSYRIVLSDFGTVRECGPDERLDEPVGTKKYWSPEFYSLNYSFKVDVWAVAVVMYGLLMAKFPFKDEKEVRTKDLGSKLKTSRCPKDGQELIAQCFDHNEKRRLDAASASQHAFLRPGQKEKTVDEDLVVEVSQPHRRGSVREPVNAAVNDWRRELVTRMERVGKESALNDPSSDVFHAYHRRYEKTWTFEWWSENAASEARLFHRSGNEARKTEAHSPDSESNIRTDILATLKSQNISTQGFSKESLDGFLKEVQNGVSQLMLDAAQYKSIVRSVVWVRLRLTTDTNKGKVFLVQEKEIASNGLETGLNQLPSLVQLAHENSAQTIWRLIDELRLGDCNIKLNLNTKESFETEESESLPGVRTVTTNVIIEGHVKAADVSRKMEPDVTYSATNPRSTRKCKWLGESACKKEGVVLRGQAANLKESALVYAAPPMPDEEELQSYLNENHIDTSKFSAPIRTFQDELAKGEARLVKTESGLMRVVDIVVLQITNQNGAVLVEKEDRTNDGVITALNRLPAIKRRLCEHHFLAAKRCLESWLMVREDSVNLQTTGVQIFSETQESANYPGITTLYKKRIISGDLVSNPGAHPSANNLTIQSA